MTKVVSGPATITVAEGVVLETTIDPSKKRHLTCDVCQRIIQGIIKFHEISQF